MTGFKDSTPRVVCAGILLPVAMVALVLFNAIASRVYWPARGEINVFTDAWRVTGTIVLKLGFALAFVSWFLFANLERTEGFVEPCLAISVIACVTGLALCLVPFLA